MWEAAPASGIGGRDEQEDRVGCFPASSGAAWLLALADGMGGHGNGDLAAEIVIDVARSMWEAYGGRIAEPQGFLATLCFAVHREINDQGRARGVSPHSTGVFLLLGEHDAHWCHVGDSRLYQFQNGTLVRRTRDHSVVQMLVELGQIDPAEMATHPDQNKLFRSLGGETDPEPSFGAAAVTARDGFVLCSDGLWETVSEPEMAAALQAADLPAAAAALVATATRRAGPHGDNVAVILARPVRAKEPKPAGAGSTGAGATSGAPVTAGTGRGRGRTGSRTGSPWRRGPCWA